MLLLKELTRAVFAVLLAAVVVRPATHYYPAGRFGSALNAQFGVLSIAERAEYSQPPFSVECWVRLRTSRRPNILVSNERREAPRHWEIFTFSDNGYFSAYLPGYTPAITIAERDIVDNHWHYVAMTFDGDTVRLFVDGSAVAAQHVRRGDRTGENGGGLWIGRAVTAEPDPGTYSDPPGCSGLIDEVRISRGLRAVTTVPSSPAKADAETLGLWNMDAGTDQGVPDLSANHNAGRMIRRWSLDDYERQDYHAGSPPMAAPPTPIVLQARAVHHALPPAGLSLDGDWQMVEEGEEQQRLAGNRRAEGRHSATSFRAAGLGAGWRVANGRAGPRPGSLDGFLAGRYSGAGAGQCTRRPHRSRENT